MAGSATDRHRAQSVLELPRLTADACAGANQNHRSLMMNCLASLTKPNLRSCRQRTLPAGVSFVR
jgi:hypothetical protein